MEPLTPELTHRMIVEYWFRVVADSPFVVDIADLICSFRLVTYDQFDAELSDDILQFNESHTEMARVYDQGDQPGWKNGFGRKIVEPGESHEWKLRIIESADGIMIGVMEADKCSDKDLEFWFNSKYAIGFHGFSGKTYTNNHGPKPCGDKYGAGDVVGVRLDLNAAVVAFSKNDAKYSDIEGFVQPDTAYRLVVGVFNRLNNRQPTQRIQIEEE